jgi:hypothetical protein
MYKELDEISKTVGRSGPASLLGGTLKQWSRVTFRSVRKQIKDLERQLLFLRMGSANDASITEIHGGEHKLRELFVREEIIAE